MDRSFLSDQRVVHASRRFVCIRLVTYEDQAEADFMKSIFTGRSGELENTMFAILSPDGNQQLTRSGRGPFRAYQGPQALAEGMNRIADKLGIVAAQRLTDTSLPLVRSVDVALNVAAADGLPLIVTVGDSHVQKQLQSELLPLAWSETVAGQFIYAAVSDRNSLDAITGIKKDATLLVVQPDPFGLSGKVGAQWTSGQSYSNLRSSLVNIIANVPRDRAGHNTHVQLGLQLGIEWESQIPETDQQSLRAKARVRGH